MSEVPKGRPALITAASVLLMMAIVALAQYLVSGRVNAGVMVAVGGPTGWLLGTNLAKGTKS